MQTHEIVVQIDITLKLLIGRLDCIFALDMLGLDLQMTKVESGITTTQLSYQRVPRFISLPETMSEFVSGLDVMFVEPLVIDRKPFAEYCPGVGFFLELPVSPLSGSGSTHHFSDDVA